MWCACVFVVCVVCVVCVCVCGVCVCCVCVCVCVCERERVVEVVRAGDTKLIVSIYRGIGRLFISIMLQ